jgi:hypothetical protein
MAITSYPRVTLQGTGPTQNPQNGTGLMVLNPSTNKYEAATAATFSGGGGGDATAANQTSQITLATLLNGYNVDANVLLTDIKSLLTDIKANQTNGSQRTVLQDSSGNLVSVTSNKLNVDTA